MNKILLLLLICLLSSKIYSQSHDEIIAPSADVAKMMEPTKVDVDYYTGRPSISLPLYVIEDGDIKIPITLNYYSGGVKLYEEATKVGLGWDLSVGGAITRSIRGLPDDMVNYGYYSGVAVADRESFYKKYIKGIANEKGIVGYPGNSRDEGKEAEQDSAFYFYQDYMDGKVDVEPDFYCFSFMGYSGRFVFENEKKMLLQTECDIEPVTDFDYNGHAIFNDIKGYSYEFSTQEYNSSESSNIDLVNTDYTYLKQKNVYNEWYPTAKYLTKVTSPTKQEAFFKYSIVRNAQGSDSIGVKTGLNQTYAISETAMRGCVQWTSPQYGDYSDRSQLMKIKIISQIETPNYIIYFDSDDTFRKDNNTNNRIDGIRVIYKNGNKLIKQIRFNYDYFSTCQPEPKDCRHLKLNSVDEIGLEKGQIRMYDFEYYNPNNFSENYQADFWGYQNENWYESYFPCLSSSPVIRPHNDPHYSRKTDPERVKTGMLTKINYPTGGHTSFNWEANRYTYIKNTDLNNESYTEYSTKEYILSTNYNAPVLEVDANVEGKIIVDAFQFYPLESYTEGQGYLQDYYDHSNCCLSGTNHQTLGNGVMSAALAESDVMKEMPVVYIVKPEDRNAVIGNIFTDNRVLGYVIITNDLIQKGREQSLSYKSGGDVVIRLKRGTVKSNSFLEGVLKEGTSSGQLRIRQEIIKTTKPGNFNYCGGVRIKSIENNDGVNSRKKEFEYQETEEFQCGVLNEVPKEVEQYYLNCVCRDKGSDFLPYLLYSNLVYRFHAIHQSSSPVGGSHVSYFYVAVKEYLDYVYLGKTVYNYTSTRDVDRSDLSEALVQLKCNIIYEGMFNGGRYNGSGDFSNICKFGYTTPKDYLRGILTKKREYDANDVLRKENEYNYLIKEKEDIQYIPSGLYTLSYCKEGFEKIYPLPPVISTRSSAAEISDALLIGTNYTIGRYRLIPYNKYLMNETVTEYIDRKPFRKIINYEYANTNSYSSSLGYSLPIKVTVKDSISREEETDTYTYYKGQVKRHAKWKNGGIISATLNSYDPTSGLLLSAQRANINKQIKPTSTDNLEYITEKKYSYEPNSNRIIEVITNGSFVTSYLWMGNRMIGIFNNVYKEDMLQSSCEDVKGLVNNAHVTCIDYDEKFPDKVLSVADPNNNTIYYEYDEFGRLVYMYDNKKNVIKHFDYKYKDE